MKAHISGDLKGHVVLSRDQVIGAVTLVFSLSGIAAYG